MGCATSATWWDAIMKLGFVGGEWSDIFARLFWFVAGEKLG